MKKLFYICLIGFLFTGAGTLAAQNTTLSYSRTLLVDNNTATVPAGHVWKVASAAPAYGPKTTTAGYNSFPTIGNDFIIVVNGTNHNISKPVVSGSGSADSYYGTRPSAMATVINYEMFPLWLPAGTTLAASTGVSYLSVIEFKENP